MLTLVRGREASNSGVVSGEKDRGVTIFRHEEGQRNSIFHFPEWERYFL